MVEEKWIDVESRKCFYGIHCEYQNSQDAKSNGTKKVNAKTFINAIHKLGDHHMTSFPSI